MLTKLDSISACLSNSVLKHEVHISVSDQGSVLDQVVDSKCRKHGIVWVKQRC